MHIAFNHIEIHVCTHRNSVKLPNCCKLEGLFRQYRVRSSLSNPKGISNLRPLSLSKIGLKWKERLVKNSKTIFPKDLSTLHKKTSIFEAQSLQTAINHSMFLSLTYIAIANMTLASLDAHCCTYIHSIKSALRSPQGETVCQSSAQANKFFGVYQEMSVVELDVGGRLKKV